jgi:hypothetical protein
MDKLAKLVGKENDNRVALLKLCWAGFKIATTNKRPTYELKKKAVQPSASNSMVSNFQILSHKYIL